MPTGHVVYAGIDASLMAVPFDATELRPKGTPVALAPDTAIARLNAPAFGFSHTGTLVRATGYLKGSRREPMHVVAVTATGTRRLLSAEAALYARGLSTAARSCCPARWSEAATGSSRGMRSSEGERVTVTVSGGRWPAWSRDGRTLFFRRGREVRAVAAAVTGDGIRFGEERAVLEWDVARSFEVGPDGTFYGVEPVPGAAEQTSLELRTGWFGEVERLAGPARR